MKNLLSQFQGINPRDPVTWGAAPRAVLFFFIFVVIQSLAWYMDWSSQIEEYEHGKQTEATLKDEFVAKSRQAVNLAMFKEQLKEIDVLFGTLLKQLPDKSQMEALITDINQAGVTKGLMFELFKPAQSESKQEFYAELPISIKVTGEYHQLGEFSAAIGQLPRIVTLNDINLTVSKEGILVMDATAKTYRYLDPEEIAQARKEAAAKRPKPGSAPAGN
jgi:type IV pilus assembly protein PilO